MDTTLKNLPVEERNRIIENLWDSIARDQTALPMTTDQVAELDRRLNVFEVDGSLGRPEKKQYRISEKGYDIYHPAQGRGGIRSKRSCLLV